MAIQNRNYFFTPTVNSERFLSQDEPTEQVMRNFADSVAFKLEVSDTATETQQGLVETATQLEFDNGIDNNANGFALYVRPSMIKNAVNALFNLLQPQIYQNSADILDIQNDITTIQGDIVNIQNEFGETMPIASMIMYPVGGLAPNPKWMYCEGQTLDNTLYPDLFSIIGYSFGGVGTNFSLPDLRKKFIAGYDDGGPAEYQTIGQGAGSNSVALTNAEIPKHTHEKGSISATSGSAGTHNHAFTGAGDDGAGVNTGIRTTQDNTPSTFDSGWINPAGAHTHSITVTGTTEDGTLDGLNGDPHENRPEFVVFPHIIKVLN